MPRVNYVKKARKDNPVAKAGEPYYWWKFRYGGKHYSKTPPRPSQLTQSEFLGGVYSAQEQLEDCEDLEQLRDTIEEVKGNIEALGEEQSDKLYAMPDSLQSGPTGELLENRQSQCEEFCSELENIDTEFDEDEVKGEVKEDLDRDDYDSDEEYEQAIEDGVEEKRTAKFEEAHGEATGIDPGWE